MSTPIQKIPAQSPAVVQPKPASAASSVEAQVIKSATQEPIVKTPLEQIQEINREIVKAKQEISNLDGQIQSLQAAKRNSQVRVVRAAELYAEKQTKIKEKRENLAKLTAEKQQKECEITTTEVKLEALKNGKTQNGWFFSSASPVKDEESSETSKKAPKENLEATKLEEKILVLKQDINNLSFQIEKNNNELEALDKEATRQQDRSSENMEKVAVKEREIGPLTLQKQSKERETAALEARRDALVQTQYAPIKPSQTWGEWAFGTKV